MLTFINYFVLTSILLVISLIFYFLRSREANKKIIDSVRKYNLFKYATGFLSLISITIYCLNLNLFAIKNLSFLNLTLINLSMSFLVISIVIFLHSLTYKNDYMIDLDYPSNRTSKRGIIKLGKVMHKDKKKHNFYLSIMGLEAHMFVCGITGTGKSNFIQSFLLNFVKQYEIPFLITEFKGEYHFLQNRIKDLLIIKPGENFAINIFDPEGANPEVHAERVFQIFESGGLLEGVEYSPQMKRVFVDILNEVCKKEEKRNWESFYDISEHYLSENKGKLSFLEQSIVAIQNQIRRYSIGTLKHIFVEKSGLNVKDLFKHKVVLDLSSIIRLGGEKEDALFFLNMIMKYLWDKNISSGSRDYKGIKHITVIEDAQYFTPERLSNRTKLTSYIEDIALLLRGTGECLISLATRPNISKEILANCGVLVSFQNHMQKDIMQELLNLDENQKKNLAMLKKGQSIIRVNSIEKPFVMKIPFIKRKWLTDEEITENNQIIIDRILN